MSEESTPTLAGLQGVMRRQTLHQSSVLLPQWQSTPRRGCTSDAWSSSVRVTSTWPSSTPMRRAGLFDTKQNLTLTSTLIRKRPRQKPTDCSGERVVPAPRPSLLRTRSWVEGRSCLQPPAALIRMQRLAVASSPCASASCGHSTRQTIVCREASVMRAHHVLLARRVRPVMSTASNHITGQRSSERGVF